MAMTSARSRGLRGSRGPVVNLDEAVTEGRSISGDFLTEFWIVFFYSFLFVQQLKIKRHTNQKEDE